MPTLPRLSRRDRPPSPTWTLALAGLGLFMAALDNLVVATALPVLKAQFHASLASLEWTVNAYVLSFACLLMTGSAVADRFGRRRMYAIGIAMFTVASAAAALSSSVAMLITARVAQGAGAALVFPLTLTLISDAFPEEKRAGAIGAWAGIGGLAVAGGPVVGGAVIKAADWHWIFWLNVPIGLIVAPLSLWRLRESFGPRPKLDIVGVALAGLAAFGLTWGMVRASALGWASVGVIAPMVAGAGVAILFIVWERRCSSPVIHLSLFRSRGFVGANLATLLMQASTFGSMFMMTQFLQIALRHSPLTTGVWLLPWTGAPMLIMPAAGRLAGRFGERAFMVAGLALQAVGLAWVAAIAAPDMSYPEFGAALAVAGLGISLVFPVVANVVFDAVPREEAGVASGTNSTMRELGAVFGVALLAAVFSGPHVYSSPHAFVGGLQSALGVGAGLSVLAILAALIIPARVAPEALAETATPALQPA